MPTEPDPRALSRAFTIMSVYSVHLTRIAARALGRGTSMNREVQLLLDIDASPGVRPSELAERLGMHRSAVSRAVRRLDRDRLVRRSLDAADRRSVHLSVTDLARRRIARFEAEVGFYLREQADEAARVVALLGGAPAADAHREAAGTRAVIDAMARAGIAFVEAIAPVVATDGLSRGTSRAALTLVHDRGGARPTEIASALGLTSAGTTDLIDRLADAGMVERRRPSDGPDRRAVLVVCTPRGEAAVTQMLEALSRQAGPMAEVFALVAAQSSDVGVA